MNLNLWIFRAKQKNLITWNFFRQSKNFTANLLPYICPVRPTIQYRNRKICSFKSVRIYRRVIFAKFQNIWIKCRRVRIELGSFDVIFIYHPYTFSFPTERARCILIYDMEPLRGTRIKLWPSASLAVARIDSATIIYYYSIKILLV